MSTPRGKGTPWALSAKIGMVEWRNTNSLPLDAIA